jgi:hypothetical protein
MHGKKVKAMQRNSMHQRRVLANRRRIVRYLYVSGWDGR